MKDKTVLPRSAAQCRAVRKLLSSCDTLHVSKEVYKTERQKEENKNNKNLNTLLTNKKQLIHIYIYKNPKVQVNHIGLL